jgi:hypothetical protein
MSSGRGYHPSYRIGITLPAQRTLQLLQAADAIDQSESVTIYSSTDEINNASTTGPTNETNQINTISPDITTLPGSNNTPTGNITVANSGHINTNSPQNGTSIGTPEEQSNDSTKPHLGSGWKPMHYSISSQSACYHHSNQSGLVPTLALPTNATTNEIIFRQQSYTSPAASAAAAWGDFYI